MGALSAVAVGLAIRRSDLSALGLFAMGWSIYVVEEYLVHRFIFHAPAPQRQFLFDLLYRLHYGHHDQVGRRFCLGAAVGQRLMDRVLERLLARRLRFQLRPSSFRPIRRNVIIWPGAFLYARLQQDAA